jgi:hypothetical protein
MHQNGVWWKWCCGQSMVGPIFLVFLLFDFVSAGKKGGETYPLDPYLKWVVLKYLGGSLAQDDNDIQAICNQT